MKCADCGIEVKYCWRCGKEFKDEGDIVHYVWKKGEYKSVYHICLKCFDYAMSSYSRWNM